MTHKFLAIVEMKRSGTARKARIVEVTRAPVALSEGGARAGTVSIADVTAVSQTMTAVRVEVTVRRAVTTETTAIASTIVDRPARTVVTVNSVATESK